MPNEKEWQIIGDMRTDVWVDVGDVDLVRLINHVNDNCLDWNFILLINSV